MKYLPDGSVRPIYIKMLAAMLVLYLVANCYFITDLINRVGRIEHYLRTHSGPP